MVKQELSKYALMVAKKISNQVWEKYDDTYGYRTEKQTANDKVSTDNPENIWFFWGQFDHDNQREFYELVTEEASKSSNESIKFLKKWCERQLVESARAITELSRLGIQL
jgi:hypothetical protein